MKRTIISSAALSSQNFHFHVNVWFYRMYGNHLDYAWIGLHKQEYNCTAGFFSDDPDCRRKGWSWQDKSEYTYPSWHDWDRLEPKSNELCARLTTNRGWDGTQCSYKFQYICEKGKIKSFYQNSLFQIMN